MAHVAGAVQHSPRTPPRCAGTWPSTWEGCGNHLDGPVPGSVGRQSSSSVGRTMELGVGKRLGGHPKGSREPSGDEGAEQADTCRPPALTLGFSWAVPFLWPHRPPGWARLSKLPWICHLGTSAEVCGYSLFMVCLSICQDLPSLFL